MPQNFRLTATQSNGGRCTVFLPVDTFAHLCAAERGAATGHPSLNDFGLDQVGDQPARIINFVIENRDEKDKLEIIVSFVRAVVLVLSATVLILERIAKSLGGKNRQARDQWLRAAHSINSTNQRSIRGSNRVRVPRC
jgi:hypothetical protein